MTLMTRNFGVLERLSAGELSAILTELLKTHPELRGEAESIATRMVSMVAPDGVVDPILQALASLDLEDLNARAGLHDGIYVGPGEAAWELLEEVADGFVADMKRKMDLGFEDAALVVFSGLVIALAKAEEVDSAGPLGWAPDFPAEMACRAASELIDASSVEKRTAVRDRVVSALEGLDPRWRGMITRTMDQTLSALSATRR